jgi:cation diffusion facilitator CzcD-associated flavoprotein CzcO
MHTLGYSFKPWTEAKAIADGPSIRKYVNETADEFDIRRHIRFDHKVQTASWDSEKARWILTSALPDGSSASVSGDFLFMCGGYYSYDKPHRPEFLGEDRYQGQVLHPQFWPEDLDYQGKKVIVIGSGATAMTMVPSMTQKGAQVTMVQRSPTYVVSRPAEDKIANTLRRWLPEKVAYAITRLKNTTLSGYFYRRTRTHPERTKAQLLHMATQNLGEDMVKAHFTPSYNPWDQRMCLIPDGDLYKALNQKQAQVVTGEIDTWTEAGLKMTDGTEVEGDIIVTATGITLTVMSGIQFDLDGTPINFPDTFTYKGMMYSGIPNMAHTFGYINASWTLRADLTAEYVCRLLNHMQDAKQTVVTPTLRPEDNNMPVRDWIEDFSAGYMRRMMHLFPKQGNDPWRNTQDYKLDKKMIRQAPIEDGALVFSAQASSAAESNGQAPVSKVA